MMLKQTIRLIFALYLCGLLSSVAGQATTSDTPVSISGTNSFTNSYTNSLTNSVSGTVSGTVSGSGSVSGSVSGTYSNTNSITTTLSGTVSNTVSNSITVSGSMSVTGVPVFTPVLFVRTPAPGELNCVTVYFQQPSPDYPNYQFTIIPPPSSNAQNNITINLVVPTSQLLFIAPYYYYTICRSNVSGINLYALYSVQVAGYFTPSVHSQPSYPIFFQLGTPAQYFGPTNAPDGTNSANALTCFFTPRNINCTFATGARPYTLAILSFNCTRFTPPTAVMGAKAHLESRLLATTPLQNTISSFLPSGCMCTGKLQTFYATAPTLVENYIVLPTSSVNTSLVSLGLPDTPTTATK